MEEVRTEAKETTIQDVRNDGGKVIDGELDKFFGASEETAGETSEPKETPEKDATKPEETGADQTKTEDSEAKEAEVPKEFHKNPAWQRIMKQRDEARVKEKELSDKFAGFESKLAEFEKVTSSPAYVRSSMEAQGYKPEAIDAKLREMGHSVPDKQVDDLQLVLRTLNIDESKLTQEGKDYLNVYIADAARVADIIVNDRLSKALPKALDPISKSVTEMTRNTTANQMVSQMKKTVADEGVLDYAKDIEPALDEFIKKNPKAMQDDVFDFFRDFNHSAMIERMKTGKKKDVRDEKRENLRGGKPGLGGVQGIEPQGKDENISKYMDRLLDAHGFVN